MHALKTTRRELLISALACTGCAGRSRERSDADAACEADADGGAQPYCLLSALRVRVPSGAALREGEAVLMNVDDNTAVILARDQAGLYARSGICTHACCVVALCHDASCGALTPTPLSCSRTPIVRPDPAHGVVCPCHGSTFRLSDGGVTKGPARVALPSYRTIVDGPDVWVDTSELVEASARS